LLEIHLIRKTPARDRMGKLPLGPKRANEAGKLAARTPLASLNDDLQHSDRCRRYWLGAYMHGVCQSGGFPKMALE